MIPGEQDFRRLLSIITDPQKFAARVDELAGYEKAAKEIIARAHGLEPEIKRRMEEADGILAEAKAARAAQDERRRKLNSESEALQNARVKFEERRDAAEAEFRDRAFELDAINAEIARLRTAVAKTKADTEQTLADARQERAKWQSLATKADADITKAAEDTAAAAAARKEINEQRRLLDEQRADLKREYEAKKAELRLREQAVERLERV